MRTNPIETRCCRLIGIDDFLHKRRQKRIDGWQLDCSGDLKEFRKIEFERRMKYCMAKEARALNVWRYKLSQV